MPRELVRDGLLFALAQRYKEDPGALLALIKAKYGSALTCEIVAELRNAGHIEEDVRGTIRFTRRGYRSFKDEPLPYAFQKLSGISSLKVCSRSSHSQRQLDRAQPTEHSSISPKLHSQEP